ncbi:MAG: GNAT family N-acetyltransferase [Chromatiales bacterium]|nr:GNAT family N-acetyltransferase [Chromatiales bacterium]
MAAESRRAEQAELAEINRVIESAIDSWGLSERVKRLSLSSYRYQEQDWDHLTFHVALDPQVVGVATWETADADDTPAGAGRALLLHGLYVNPQHQGRGVGTRLLQAAIDAARGGGFGGVLVKAHAKSQTFFANKGFDLLSITDPRRDYPYRYWRAIP